ncbi:hypothetical protein EDD85DRAFT_934573 [Armillaria nabsnona]|nr:hypothetical protein EDD85DRAFT_934573 [Armillaria nabsnona]
MERDIFSASQSQAQPTAEYTLSPVPMPKGEEESGLPMPSSSSRSLKPFACFLLPPDIFPARDGNSYSVNHLGSNYKRAERAPVANLHSRRAKNSRREGARRQIKKSGVLGVGEQTLRFWFQCLDRRVWSQALRDLKTKFRLNESFQSLQTNLADHKNTIRVLNAALLQYSQDSRPSGDTLTLTEATLRYTGCKE